MRTSEEMIKIVKTICDKENIKSKELASMVGLSTSAISKYFNGTREFPINKVGDFAKALNITPEYLLGMELERPDTVKKVDRNISIVKEKDAIYFKLKIDAVESEMIDVLKELNKNGREEALKRVKEMLCIPTYIKE